MRPRRRERRVGRASMTRIVSAIALCATYLGAVLLGAGRRIHLDDGHLTADGSTLLADALAPRIARLASAAAVSNGVTVP